MTKVADCGCVYHAEQGIPCEHDKALNSERPDFVTDGERDHPMTIQKRWRVLLAALTQTWTEQRCKVCGASWWSSEKHPMPDGGMCVTCEGHDFDRWVQDFQARTEAERQGAA